MHASIKANNSVSNKQKITDNNFKLDIVNMNTLYKSWQILSNGSKVIEWKRNAIVHQGS